MPSGSEKPVSRFAPQGMITLWIVLFVAWMVANSTLAVEVALTGAAITLGLAYIFTVRGDAWRHIRWTPSGLYHFLAYTGTFIVELVKANLNMMRYVYSPRIDIKPGIVKVRTRLKSPIGRLALCQFHCPDPRLSRSRRQGRDDVHPLARRPVDRYRRGDESPG